VIPFGDLLAAVYQYRVPLAVVSIAGALALAAVAWRAGWIAALARRPRLAGALVGMALVVGLPLAWYLASPLFIRTELVEPPVVAAVDPTPVPARTTPPATSIAPDATAPAAAVPTPATPTPVPLAAPRSGEFEGTDEFHFGRGTATLLETAPGEWTIRLEDFSVRNGPDLYVYLSPDPGDYADGAIEVARLKATDGSFNVPLPAGVDPTGQRSVLIWCKQFSHLFAVATLEG
jgi:hypothetical protein